MSGEEIVYTIGNYTPPGEVHVESHYQFTPDELNPREKEMASGMELRAEDSFTILERREIESSLEGSQIRIKNVGNVRYQEMINFTLVGGQRYVINKYIDLPPGKYALFDIGLDVPPDNYTVTLPYETAVVQNVSVSPTIEQEDVYTKQEVSSLRTVVAVLFVLIFLFVSWWSYFHYYHTKEHTKEVKDTTQEMMTEQAKEIDRQKGKMTREKEQAKQQEKRIILLGKMKGKTEEYRAQKDTPPTDTPAGAMSGIMKKAANERTFIPSTNIFIVAFTESGVAKDIINKQEMKYGEEREITALFAEVKNMSRISQEAQRSGLRDAVRSAATAMAEAVKQYNGVVSVSGDTIFCLFISPRKGTSRTISAIRVAMVFRQQLKKLRKALEEKELSPLILRIGIHTGKAIIGSFGAIKRVEYSAMDDAVAIAARLQNAAKRGQVVIAADIYQRVKEHVQANELGLYKVSESKRPVMVYDIIGLQ
jgi:class 3 adenylate cyclase